MKRKSENPLKVLETVILLVMLIVIGSCSSNSDKSNNNISENENTKTKAPTIDIHTASVTGDLQAIKQHIAAGSDLNTLEPYGGSTPLITAIVLGKNEAAITLINGGADINISNTDGSTPIYCAAFFGRTELVKILLEKGADKSVRNNFGSSPLESVSVPFDTLRGIYDQISKDMGPLGLKLDYKELELARTKIAELLR